MLLPLGHMLPFPNTLRVRGLASLANSTTGLGEWWWVMLLKIIDAEVVIGDEGFMQ